MDNSSLAAGATVSHYRVVSQLGVGGMGEVYLAQDTTELERTVAIKVLPAELASDKDRLRRFIQEAKTASSLNHPNILTIHEIGEADSTRFIVTEFIDGETLRQRLSQSPLELREALDITIQVASALVAAHKVRIVHRDVKPENIMVRRDDGLVKVLDFGLAKLSEPPAVAGGFTTDEEAQTRMQNQTRPGVVMGTVAYMSPEQARGQEVDARTDIFSLGVVLYEMVTGKVPFAGSSTNEVISAILSKEQSAPLARFAHNVPDRLEEIVTKALTKDREERYQSAKDLLIDLKRLKQKLEVDAEIERTVAPELKTVSGTAQSSGAQEVVSTAQASAIPTATGEGVHPTSSAEYILTEIKRHRRGLTITLAALVLISIAGLTYYLYSARTGKPIDSIAVLPLINASGDQNTEYLSDGISETLINSLTQLQQLRVIARTTAFRYKGKDIDPQAVGRELNVRAVLMGRVRQMGDRLNIQVDLIDASTGAQLWGEEYERKASDVLAVKQDIAREITEKLRLRLSGEEQKQLVRRDTTNAEAYQLYLKGRYFWNKRTADGLKKAIEQFQQAIERDPNYALAYAGLADCYLVLEQYTGAPASETLPKAKAAAERALQIDDSLAEAHTSLASFYHQSWQWEESEREFKRAISLNPNYPTAHHWYQTYLRTRGRLDEALAEIKRAQELDPLSPIFEVNIATVYINRGDLDAAMKHARQLVELNPNYPLAHEPLGRVYLKQHRYEEAVVAFQKDVANDRTAYSLANLGHGYAIAGRRDEAMAVLKELEEKYKKREALGQYIAAVYVGFGDTGQAFAWLEKDFQARSGLLEFVIANPLFDSIRGDPRYTDLLRRMGLKS